MCTSDLDSKHFREGLIILGLCKAPSNNNFTNAEPHHSNRKSVKMDLRKDFVINKAHLLFAFLVTLWQKKDAYLKNRNILFGLGFDLFFGIFKNLFGF